MLLGNDHPTHAGMEKCKDDDYELPLMEGSFLPRNFSQKIHHCTVVLFYSISCILICPPLHASWSRLPLLYESDHCRSSRHCPEISGVPRVSGARGEDRNWLPLACQTGKRRRRSPSLLGGSGAQTQPPTLLGAFGCKWNPFLNTINTIFNSACQIAVDRRWRSLSRSPSRYNAFGSIWV